MEFYCVLSVGGSLASYQLVEENSNSYKAVLRTGSGRRDDVPEQLQLHKENGEWQAEPWHMEVVQALVHAIEGNHR
jgi:hypothetical protein